MSAQAKPTFEEVKGILDRLVNGRDWKRLKIKHGRGFGWATEVELRAAVVDPGGDEKYRLIDPELVRQKQGEKTHLVVALQKGVGGFSRMPKGGPYATQEEIATIVAWINGLSPRVDRAGRRPLREVAARPRVSILRPP